MYPGVSIITLGVADIAAATRFYQDLGWRLSRGASNQKISFFKLNNIVLGLFGAVELVADSGLAPPAAEAGYTRPASAMLNAGLAHAGTSRQTSPEQVSPVQALPGQARIVLAQNYPSQSAVRRAMDEARDAGAQILVEPSPTFWGGFHGIFSDLDGHVWELAHNPSFPLAPDGSIDLPE